MQELIQKQFILAKSAKWIKKINRGGKGEGQFNPRLQKLKKKSTFSTLSTTSFSGLACFLR